MNREEKLCVPLKIIKVLADFTHIDEKWTPAGEREIIILVPDANLKKLFCNTK